jgi:hypothetical protein
MPRLPCVVLLGDLVWHTAEDRRYWRAAQAKGLGLRHFHDGEPRFGQVVDMLDL